MNLNRRSRLCGHRQPDHKYHNRDRHGQRNPAKFASGNRGGCNYHRCRYVRRAQELVPNSGIAIQGGGSGENSPGASFPIWSCS